MTEISVIISNFNGAKYLSRLFETLYGQIGLNLEIIVVDRNSSDESDSILACYPDIRVIKHRPETGLVCGYAIGAEIATKKLLYFCNEDMWYEPDCLSLLAEVMNNNESVGAVMPVQWTYDQLDIVNCGAWFQKASWWRSNPYPFRRAIWKLPTCTTIVSGVNAGACMIRRDVYDQIGGWDRSFFLDYEDMDLSIRLWQYDWKCLVVPSAKVYHAVGASNAKVIEDGRQTVSRKRYIEGSSNVSAIAVKSFTGFSILLPFLALAHRFVINLVRLRFRFAWWDLLVFKILSQRMSVLWAYRVAHRNLNHLKPGQEFFTDPLFDSSMIKLV